VPVRVHDQCFTSEAFRSQRWVNSYSHCDESGVVARTNNTRRYYCRRNWARQE
jgi:GTP cyclohydrolase II